ncbi:sigma-54-dependent transcriptional regulator [Celerinatantimonas yamalensis]|uniref:Sigma-54 dependent transcriptional regulator n=1 Tax=Celerinatantimonas yamalensis TaxID=559956 RepID=A0ABW9GAW0_9GAMM
MNKPRVLLTEDSPSLAAMYQAYLRDESIQLEQVSSGKETLDYLERQWPDVLLLDLMLPDMDGMDILQRIYEQGLNCSVVIITAHGSVDKAVDAMRFGASDFLSKPFDAKRLKVTLANTLKIRRLNQLVHGAHEPNRENYFDFVGNSLSMQRVYRVIESAANSKATIFVTGESGTGKELCASAVHQASGRKDAPFIAINCAAIPKDLMESEIFGHLKGAFTGAVHERKGAAQMANSGTLFLDEICEMDLELQSKLLRFIQTGTFQPVGSSQTEKVDVRFVCATNRDPLEEVRLGRFREDLYYRLHVIPLHLPPLRERGDDVLQIAQHILMRISEEEQSRFCSFDQSAQQVLLHYDWPGNVRQLENVIRNTVVLNDGEQITPVMFPAPLSQVQPVDTMARTLTAELKSTESAVVKHVDPLWKQERRAIEQAIDFCDGNIPKAASLLEVSPSTLYRKLQSWDN